MNPVIDAIDAGHVMTAGDGKLHGKTVCRRCAVLWPCKPVAIARRVNASRSPQHPQPTRG